MLLFAGPAFDSPLIDRLGDNDTGSIVVKTNHISFQFISDGVETFRGYRIDVYTTTDKDLLGEKIDWEPSTN